MRVWGCEGVCGGVEGVYVVCDMTRINHTSTFAKLYTNSAIIKTIMSNVRVCVCVCV